MEVSKIYDARQAFIKEHNRLPSDLRVGSAVWDEAMRDSRELMGNEIPPEYLDVLKVYAVGMTWHLDETLPPSEFVLS